MMTIAKKIVRKIIRWIYCLASMISPELNTQIRFLRLTGKFGNLKNPQTFSEKLSWLKLNRYMHDPLVIKCADKYRVREYLEECGLEKYLNPLYGVYRDPEEIDWESLPESFVLKVNFGCGYNILCKNKTDLDEKQTKKQLSKWLKSKYWLYYSEFQYDIPDKLILHEKFLHTDHPDGLLDYKFYCFHGKVMAVLVISRTGEEKAAIFMSPQWEIMSEDMHRYSRVIIPEKPQALEEMIQASEIMSKPFPFVRVDFYEHEGRPVFGELTFTPASAVSPSETMIDGKQMGEYIKLN